MAKDTLEKLKEIIGEDGTLGMDSAEENWSTEETQVQEAGRMDSCD